MVAIIRKDGGRHRVGTNSRPASATLDEGSGDQLGGALLPRILDTPRAGFRWVEAVVDSGTEASAAPPNVFPREIHASATHKTGGKHKAANGTRIPNLGPQKIRFHDDEGQICGVGL